MSTPPASIVEAVSVDTVDDVVTLATREPPMKAYTTTGTMQVYKPIWTGMFATVAYAIPSGMTTAPVLSPARMSAFNQRARYGRIPGANQVGGAVVDTTGIVAPQRIRRAFTGSAGYASSATPTTTSLRRRQGSVHGGS